MATGRLIRVLGPIDLVTTAGPIAVGGRRPRALLGALVIAAGRAVPIAYLRDVVWGERQPKSADNTLQCYVSDLRHLLGHDTIVLTDHSYELRMDAVDIDALRFEELVRKADAAHDRPDERRSMCAEALALWRGRPFGELADDEAFDLEALRLDELRLTAMELSLEADLALGRHELVVGELEALVEEHPFRERFWYLLIEALALGDRRVEALRACARLRRTLAEIGIEVGANVAALEHLILDGTAIEPG